MSTLALKNSRVDLQNSSSFFQNALRTVCLRGREAQWAAVTTSVTSEPVCTSVAPHLNTGLRCQEKYFTTQILAASKSTQISKYMYGVRRIIAENAKSFGPPSFYQIKPPATLPCKNLRTPHLIQNVLMKVSQI